MDNQFFQLEGIIKESLPNTLFRVEADFSEVFKNLGVKVDQVGTKRIILCHISGKMRMHYIRILPGDKVKIEVSPYDLNKGRIIYRER